MAASKLRLKPGVETFDNSLVIIWREIRASLMAMAALKAKRSMTKSEVS
jgi:hypothetical protein